VVILFLETGLLASNLVALAVIAIIVIPAYLRRILVEENMLAEGIGPAYLEYMKRTRSDVHGGKK